MKSGFGLAKLGILSLLLAVSVSLTGCGGAKKQPIGGASQEKYLFGTYSALFACGMREMDKAVRETCSKAKLTLLKRTNNLNECYYLYRDINDVKLHVTILEQKDNTVKIKLKVGSTGDKESCQMILIEIDSHLRSQGALL